MTSIVIGLFIVSVLVSYKIGHADGRLEAQEAEAHRTLARLIKQIKSGGAPHGQ